LTRNTQYATRAAENQETALTTKLYYDNPYQREFTARVVERLTLNRRPAVVLDCTAFYPTSGGQPCDHGTLNGVAVLDVSEREDGQIVHVLGGPLADEQVAGVIDWARRFDHMQQHTGQHILSQACERLGAGSPQLPAETVGFHLGDEVCTIDLSCTSLSPEQVAAIEDLANQMVFENRPVIARFVTAEELAQRPQVRARLQPPTGREQIRLVEVQGFDWSLCGGTHVRAAGEIGLIKVRKWERRGDTVRVDFYCGRRALADYRWKNAAVNELAASLSIKDDELAATVPRLLAEAAESRRQLTLARERLLDYEAAELAAGAEPVAAGRVVRQVFDGRNVEEVRHLAQRLTARPGIVALLGVRADKAQLIFARAADLTVDVNALLKTAVAVVGGRGGGTPTLAQGGGPEVARLEEALAVAYGQLAQTGTPSPAAAAEGKGGGKHAGAS
jgi:alanyl-tRNA synthetase